VITHPKLVTKPIVVNTILDHELAPAEIDRDVTEYAAHGDSLYTLDTQLLNRLKP
jgi:hypothetical protein